jgi:hypothetical protein
MYDIFLLFCFLILLLSFGYIVYILCNYFRMIKYGCFKLHFNNSLYNVIFLLTVAVCFLFSILIMLITKSFRLLPYSSLFLILFTNRFIEFVLLYTDDKLLIKNKLIDISSIEKVQHKKIIFNIGNLLIILFNNSSVNIVVSNRTESFLKEIFQTYKTI